MPTLSAHVRDDWEFADEFSSVVKAEHRGKQSPYIVRAIEQDLISRRAKVADVPPTIMVDLTRDLLGKPKAREIAAALDGLDQEQELIELLKSYIADRSEKPKSKARGQEKLLRE